MNPEHLHLALNHIPIIGLACSLIPIVAGILAKNKTALISGLVLAVVCGWTTPVVMETGEMAYERYESGSVRRYLDPGFEDPLEAHEHRAEKGSVVFYVAAVLATLSLGLALWRFEAGRWAAILTALACLASVATGVWIADSGGKIRRVDFRDNAPASLPAAGEHDAH